MLRGNIGADADAAVEGTTVTDIPDVGAGTGRLPPNFAEEEADLNFCRLDRRLARKRVLTQLPRQPSPNRVSLITVSAAKL